MAAKVPRLVASVGLAVLLAVATVTAAWAAIEGQCDSVDGKVPGHCAGRNASGADRHEGDATAALEHQPGEEQPLEMHEDSSAAGGALPVSEARSSGKEIRLDAKAQSLGLAKLSILFGFCGIMILWIGLTIKWACDGSLPARLAIWGLLPEAYAAITVGAVAALLRMKSGSTPVVLLRNCVTDRNARDLAEALRLYGKKAELVSLELPYNGQLGEEGLRTLVDVILQEGLAIEEIDLSYNPQLGDAALTAMKPLWEPKSSRLNTLRLIDCGLRGSSLSVLAAGAARLRLQTLDLSGNDLAGAGEQLVEVLEAPLLEELMLSCCELELEDVKAVAEQLPYTSLRSLQLAANGIGSEGLQALAEQLPKSKVEELGLEGNQLKAEDLSFLGTAWAKRPFSRLRLQGNPMSPDDMASFIRALRSMQA